MHKFGKAFTQRGNEFHREHREESILKIKIKKNMKYCRGISPCGCPQKPKPCCRRRAKARLCKKNLGRIALEAQI